MGWKGTVRSISAAMRAAERDAQRRHKAALKQQVIDDSAAAVADWDAYVEELTSVHRDLAGAIDWQALSSKPRPLEPNLEDNHERIVEQKLRAFKPRFFDFLNGGPGKRRQRLEDSLATARARDRSEFEAALFAFRAADKEWETDTDLARRLVAGEVAAIKEVIQEMQSISEQSLVGSSVGFLINDEYLHAIPVVHTEEIVPNTRRKQLASGKLSETRMPAGQFNELYQDYVASVALKIAGDLFHVLPLDEIYVTCTTEMLNTQTGYLEPTPILSVHFVKQTFAKLNLTRLDPSDSMSNFNHVMSFKKTKGLQRIEPLKPIE